MERPLLCVVQHQVHQCTNLWLAADAFKQPCLPVSSGTSMDVAKGFPVRTKLYTRLISGVPTDFSFSLYADRLLLFITQLGSAGTIISASNETAFDAPGPTFTTSVLIGKRDEPLLPLCARQLAEVAQAGGCNKPLVICLGLKDHSPAVIKEVIAQVSQDNVWS